LYCTTNKPQMLTTVRRQLTLKCLNKKWSLDCDHGLRGDFSV
jgi:hypothetical protein